MTQGARPEEGRLVTALRSGDQAAVRTLYRRHTPRLRAVILRMVDFDLDLAEDLIQETWINAVRGIDGFRAGSAFETWLIAIGARRTFSYLRRHTRRVGLAGHLDPLGAVEPPVDATRIDVERALAHLPDLDRCVVVLHALEGYPHREIAGLLEIPEGTSRAVLSRARSRLRQLLSDGANHDHR